jgi:hypothetical protein
MASCLSHSASVWEEWGSRLLIARVPHHANCPSQQLICIGRDHRGRAMLTQTRSKSKLSRIQTVWHRAHSDDSCTGPFIPYDSEGTGSVRVNNGLYISAEDCKRRGGEDFMPFTTTAWGATPKLWEGCLKLSEVTPSRYFNLRDANFQINGLCFGKPES